MTDGEGYRVATDDEFSIPSYRLVASWWSQYAIDVKKSMQKEIDELNAKLLAAQRDILQKQYEWANEQGHPSFSQVNTALRLFAAENDIDLTFAKPVDLWLFEIIDSIEEYILGVFSSLEKGKTAAETHIRNKYSFTGLDNGADYIITSLVLDQSIPR